MTSSLSMSEMARLSGYDLSALLIQGATNANTTNFASNANSAISSLRESINSNILSAVNNDNAVKNQNTTNFASDASSAISSLKESVNSKNSMTYAVKGDNKYDEDMDADSDGTISYSEYIKYATNQGLERYNMPTNSTIFTRLLDTESGMTKPQILNLGKALNSYMTNSIILPQSLIIKEA